MKLKILDISNYIEKTNIKPVTSISIYSKGTKLDPNGLFSEEIFGRIGSKERRTTFGYIDLKGKFIHPEAFKLISLLDSNLSKMINNKKGFIINDNGEIIESETGQTGILFFSENIDKINWKILNKKKPKNLEFITKNFDKIFIDKYLILPAGIRDIQTSASTGKTMIQYSEIIDLYKTLIQQIKTLPTTTTDTLYIEIISPMMQQIQRSLLTINDWFKSRMKGKQGLIRGSLTKKVIDYSGRFIITTDNSLELGYVGISWQNIIKLYEPFVFNYIYQKDQQCLGLIQNFLKSDSVPDMNELKRFFTKLTEDSLLIDEQLKQSLTEIAKEVVKDKVVLYKRDPVENRDSYIAANVRVDPDGYTLAINPLDLPRTGADQKTGRFIQ